VLLGEAAIDEASNDDEAGTVVVEATSLTSLPFADIVARHGNVERLSPDARHFKAAFVVVSADPAPEALNQLGTGLSPRLGGKVRFPAARSKAQLAPDSTISLRTFLTKHKCTSHVSCALRPSL